VREALEMTDVKGPLQHDCDACRTLDRFDGVEDGHFYNSEHLQSRHENALFEMLRRSQNEVADKVTSFAGSLKFVYLHIGWFVVWIGINVGLIAVGHPFDKFPFGLLTMIVSLEAIFLSTFVMVSQNRQARREGLRAELDFEANIRSQIWSIHIGQHLGIDVQHVESIVRKAIEAAQQQMKQADQEA
jgi:uncharacterized membrane protein